MKRGTIWIVLTCLIVTSLVLASCATSTTSTSTTTSTPTTTTSTTTTIKTTAAPPTTAATTAATTGNWWDKLGKPQYGGTMTLRINKNVANFDPYFAPSLPTIDDAWLERLHGDDWTLNPSVFDYSIDFRPSQYVKGNLAESWEFTDPSTYVIHLRKGIYWQNIPPVNGREFTADDVVWHYDRLFGLGSGMIPSPYYAVAAWKSVISLTAADKYTIVVKWSISNPELITETMQEYGSEHGIEAREAVQQWGNLNDWHHAIGTGPFILQDFVENSSATLVRNPNYWGFDERYPQNKLPYLDTIKYLIIPDDATALAGLRTGKIDTLDGISLQNAQLMQKTNPAMLQMPVPAGTAFSLDPRNDVAPFKDIRVREAMQMAIDLPTIAKSYYGGTTDPSPSSLTSRYETGWGFPYKEWPQDLKDQYAYNPTKAKQLLADAGYPNGFKTDIVVDASSDIDLLQVVKSYFDAIGINMDIRLMESSAWVAFVRTGRKQDALASRGSGASSLGLSYEPLRQLNRFQTNYTTNWLMISDPVFDAFYTKAMADTKLDDIKQVMRDANEYVARQHYAISLLQPVSFNICEPWLKGYNGQAESIWGLNGPAFLGFYAARFWIDQNLKRSMGY